jgi:5-(carboxyamino)imidazole ribonucleotide synthase
MKKTIGILGGGQLGRMTAEAAARLGITAHIYTPHSDDCALQIAADFTVAGFDDLAALTAFARSVDVVTYEFENIPAVAVEEIEAIVPVYPNSAALRVTQNRVREKSLCRDLDIPTAPWREVKNLADAAAALAEFGAIIIKTAEMGYDGKGQWKITSEKDLAAVAFNNQLIAEGIVKFDFEISVIAARGLDGEIKCYPPVRNEHKNHILWQTHAPAELPPAMAKCAEDYTKLLAEKLNIIGLLAVEMFVVSGEILVNEMAPRPHNSGHWTIEGAATSQFEQLVRAITGMPLGDVTPRGKFVMTNLIGDDFTGGKKLAKELGGVFHDYGKQEIRPGRKMGHVTHQIK